MLPFDPQQKTTHPNLQELEKYRWQATLDFSSVILLILVILSSLSGKFAFKTVNIHFMDSLVSNDMINSCHIIQYNPCSQGRVFGNIAQGTTFLDTLPRVNIRHTSLHGEHRLCSSNDADRPNQDICRQATH